MAKEMEMYDMGPVSRLSDDGTDCNDSMANRLDEAADIYGDIATAEDYGYVNRG